MQRKALALLSGGLDSTLAVKIMLDQGIKVEALNFTSPFCTCTGKNSGCKSEAVRVAEEFDIPIKVINKGLEYLEIVRKPKHGYGKGMNPCIDCRIFLLRKAKEYMAECGADFIITGEVLGQRPMSQRRNSMQLIERESGLEGLLLRPLSAGHFPPTIPETEGWVDRNRLPSIQGRSRKEQMELAEDLDIRNYPCPAGGCLLTELSFVSKIRDVFDHTEELNIRDFQLLKTGRHFRIGERTKVIIGRDEADNDALERMRQSNEAAIRWVEGSSPVGVIVGAQDDALLEIAAKILLRYTKSPIGTDCTINVRYEGVERQIITRHEFDEARIEELRI
jgi:tRNA U34 2-thiouridine synthase MnmA/TrmU